MHLYNLGIGEPLNNILQSILIQNLVEFSHGSFEEDFSDVSAAVDS